MQQISKLFEYFLLLGFCVSGLAINFFVKIMSKNYLFNFDLMIFYLQLLGILILSLIVIIIRDIQQKKERILINIILKTFKVPLMFLPMIIAYLVHGIYLVKSNQELSIPVYLAGRRAKILFLIIVKAMQCDFKKVNRGMVIYSVMIVLSAVVAVHEELQEQTPYGLMLLVLANFGTAFYNDISESIQKKGDLDSLFLQWQTSVFSIVPMQIIILVDGEYYRFQYYMDTSSPTQYGVILTCLVILTFFTFTQQYFLFMCTKYSSAFSVMNACNIKDLVATTLSILFVHDVVLNGTMIASLSISFISTFAYGFYVYYRNKKSKPLIEPSFNNQSESLLPESKKGNKDNSNPIVVSLEQEPNK